ncbi:P-loop containing nucleoside triphosphate hydrolase protein [Scenedesmus sp. NREL 46B-D3]|nr:P-loop containing nucleoside triphosphate hydrolase protein [Scenedesmus sp. NREL 46B-D3]
MDAFIHPLVYPRLFGKLSKGILLYGLPGTGKTYLIKAAIKELQEHRDILFFAPTAAELKGKYVGETEANIAALFRYPRRRAIAVILFDEFDSIAANRGTDASGIAASSVNTLLQEMDGIGSYENVVVVAATNLVWNLDKAIRRRFQAEVHVALPDQEMIAKQLRQAIERYLKHAADALTQSQMQTAMRDLRQATRQSEAIISLSKQQLEVLDRAAKHLDGTHMMHVEEELKAQASADGLSAASHLVKQTELVGRDDITLRDVIGLEEEKIELSRAVIYPLLYPSLYGRLPRGTLFYGLPGTGKTMLVKAMVNELKKSYGDALEVLFFAPAPAQLKGKYVGETEQRVAAWFDTASAMATERSRQLGGAKRVVAMLFFDEFDAIAGSREDDATGMMSNSVNMLLQKMDGISSATNVIVLASTNYPSKIDSAIRRRFMRQVLVPLPSAAMMLSQIQSTLFAHFTATIRELPNAVKIEEHCPVLRADAKQQLENFVAKLASLRYSGSDVARLTSKAIAHAGAAMLKQLKEAVTDRTKTVFLLTCSHGERVCVDSKLVSSTGAFRGSVTIDEVRNKAELANLIITIDDFEAAFAVVKATATKEERDAMAKYTGH